MTEILQQALGPALAAAIALVGVIYTQRQSKSAQAAARQLEKKAVDAEAYMRARQFDDIAIRRMETEVKSVRGQMADLQKRHDEEMRAKDIAVDNMQNDWRQTLQLHAAWDALAIQHLKQVDHDLPSAPPLYPPRAAREQREGPGAG